MQDFISFLSSHAALTLAAIIILLLVMIVEFIRAKRNNFHVDPAKAVQLINHENAHIVDIRARDAFLKGHIIDAHSITAQEIKQSSKKIEKLKNKPLIIVCNAGIESQKIAAQLQKQGYNAFSLSGGMRAWLDAEMPLVKD